jgi:competence protein ComEA
MFKKFFAKFCAIAAFVAVFGHAFAAVDVNTANEDALRGIKGIGPAKAKAILDERAAHGPFKDPTDLAKRVKGLGGQTVERLQGEGLAVGAAKANGNVNVASAQAKGAPAAAGAQKNSAAVVVKK